MNAVADDIPQDENLQKEAEALRFRDRLAGIIGRLEKEAEDRVSKRDLVEKRWLEDLSQYHGKYDDRVLADLKEAEKSTLFINQTRPKTNAMEARLSDMLFPTDDRNWGIQPTPVPELTVEAEQVALEAAQVRQQAAQAPENQALQQQAQLAEDSAQAIQSRLDEARKRARSMEEEIADHLKECRYAVQSRDVIHDACVLGTGIMKGPVIGGRSRRSWQAQPVLDEMGNPVGEMHVMADVADVRPVFWRVDPWNFFPDMDARTMEDCDGVYERHLMNAKDLRNLARQPGFDPDAVRRLLRDTPRSTTPTYISDLRSITGTYHDTTADRYHVWEYHGPLAAEDMADLARLMDQQDMLEDLDDPAEIDPLQEINVTVWFCQGEILKFGIHHLDSGDPIYSVFCLEKDHASIFGFGVPYLMRDAQKSLNAGWRIMLDNAGLSSGPQIEVDQDVVEPADGRWGLAPRKIWLRRPGANPNAPGIRTYNIDSYQGELANIIELSRRNIDDETSVPLIAQGEQGSHITQTAHGMSILMNSVNVVFRRIVKNWDDDMTTPNIRRMYDFLMQFSPKNHIKGDFEVDARGTSVLLVREMQTQNLMAFLMQFGAHPMLAPFLRDGGLPALRRLTQAMMIPANELIKTDEELAEEAAAAAANPPEPDPRIMEIEAKMNLAEMEMTGRMQIAEFERETRMMMLAAQMNMKLDEVRARLEDGRQSRESKERQFAAEAAMTERHGPTGGGHF